MASRSVASTFSGMLCPDNMSFGRAHGPNPVVGSLALTVPTGLSIDINLGDTHTLQIGASTFVGPVVSYEDSYDGDANRVINIQFADWRDRLHDKHFFGSFNMVDDKGRYFHQLPFYWQSQKKTYLNRRITLGDLQVPQALDGSDTSLLNAAKANLISAASILNYLGIQHEFYWYAGTTAALVLTQSKPENLDWNNGVKIADAIEALMRRIGLRFHVFGSNEIFISMRGTSDIAFPDPYTVLCGMGGKTGRQGNELNDRGRRIKIVGSPNVYQWRHPCIANWNTSWTFQLCYNEILLSAWLVALSSARAAMTPALPAVTMDSPLRDLPEPYQDFENWDGKPRNNMSIRDYIDKVCFHCYVVDFETIVVFDPEGTRPNRGINGYTAYVIDRDTFEVNDDEALATPYVWWMDGHKQWLASVTTPDPTETDDGKKYGYWNSYWPIARSLPSLSDEQFILYGTARSFSQNNTYPFPQQYPFVRKDDGAKLDIETLINTDTGQEEYRVRLLFTEPHYWNKPGVNPYHPDSVQPDFCVIDIAVERELFTYQMGEAENGTRVREQVKTVSELHRAFVNGNEVTTLYLNYVRQVESDGDTEADAIEKADPQTPPPTDDRHRVETMEISAEIMAEWVANQFMYHEYTTKSGTFEFNDICGIMPDGTIDSVSTRFDASNGLVEHVNLSNVNDLSDSGPGNEYTRPIGDRKGKGKKESELINDWLKRLANAGTQDKRVLGKATETRDTTMMSSGGQHSAIQNKLALGRDRTITMQLNLLDFDPDDADTLQTLEPDDVLIVGAMPSV